MVHDLVVRVYFKLIYKTHSTQKNILNCCYLAGDNPRFWSSERNRLSGLANDLLKSDWDLPIRILNRQLMVIYFKILFP